MLFLAMSSPDGVGGVLSARHECMELRGARAVGSTTITPATRGALDLETVLPLIGES